jgi:hypothetical protein
VSTGEKTQLIFEERIMLEILAAVEADLPRLLLDESVWSGLYIDYHPPTVGRLWMPWRDCRVYLHRIYPCAKDCNFDRRRR